MLLLVPWPWIRQGTGSSSSSWCGTRGTAHCVWVPQPAVPCRSSQRRPWPAVLLVDACGSGTAVPLVVHRLASLAGPRSFNFHSARRFRLLQQSLSPHQASHCRASLHACGSPPDRLPGVLLRLTAIAALRDLLPHVLSPCEAVSPLSPTSPPAPRTPLAAIGYQLVIGAAWPPCFSQHAALPLTLYPRHTTRFLGVSVTTAPTLALSSLPYHWLPRAPLRVKPYHRFLHLCFCSAGRLCSRLLTAPCPAIAIFRLSMRLLGFSPGARPFQPFSRSRGRTSRV